jgi:4-amino-4-deoxy-L-arabinose transferase-like glycosyltransferase
LPAILACGLFITLGVLFIPLAGIQTDEALFGSPVYLNTDNHLWGRLARLDVPLMVMSYLGSLKSFVYLPILEIFGANVWSIRLPMVLAGAVTIFIFYQLLLASVGRNAALLGAFLLATDPMFLMTNTFDWGPVALEHFLLVTGCWALFRFGTAGGSKWHLAVGFFCFGLALWNKAVFLWALAGVGVAGVAVFWPQVHAALTRANLRVAAAAFLLGASPFVYFNTVNPLITVRQNAHLVPAEIPGKWIFLEGGLQGNSLFGYIAAEEWTEPVREATGPVGRASLAIRDALGPRRQTGFYYVLAALLALVPLWWRSRAAWFSLVFLAVAWLWMAMTHDAGGGAHHVVLLWPFPIFFAAAVLRKVPGWGLPLIGIPLVGLNLSVDNQYLAQLTRYGPFGTFTEAIFPLSEALNETNPIYVTDWGMFDNLNLLHQGRLHLRPAGEQQADFERMLLDPNGLLLGHTAGQEAYPGVRIELDRRIGEAGFRRQVLRTITDSSGRPVFEISRAVAAR